MLANEMLANKDLLEWFQVFLSNIDNFQIDLFGS